MKKVIASIFVVFVFATVSVATQVPGTPPDYYDRQMDSVLIENWTFNAEFMAIDKAFQCWHEGCDVTMQRAIDKFRVRCTCPQPSYRAE